MPSVTIGNTMGALFITLLLTRDDSREPDGDRGNDAPRRQTKPALNSISCDVMLTFGCAMVVLSSLITLVRTRNVLGLTVRRRTAQGIRSTNALREAEGLRKELATTTRCLSKAKCLLSTFWSVSGQTGSPTGRRRIKHKRKDHRNNRRAPTSELNEQAEREERAREDADGLPPTNRRWRTSINVAVPSSLTPAIAIRNLELISITTYSGGSGINEEKQSSSITMRS
ncbi:hypothetical protein BD410DRAFT_799020 [Rickenella mellea]|uniref:Uncharacterized protein n=1 Tax=Rickenella mellea TaxID=50990 RepID=A0A4Y7QML7_9AGAM|nr:hypothetical protein BD410DRAFT_799020 [Rickenella mellea]